MELTEIKGIGDKKAEELKKLGICTAEDLAILHPRELASVLGISWKSALEIINDAQNKCIQEAVELYTLKQTEERLKRSRKFISTGSKQLDNLLGGGVRTDAITMVYGEFATAKTQLAFQLMVNALAQYENSKVVYIETESGSFSPERLKEIKPTVGNLASFDERVYHVPARTIATPEHQYLAYIRVKKLLEAGEPIILIVVDSFTKVFRAFYQTREQLGDRSRELARHFCLLDMLASKYNLAVFLTSQVMGQPTSEQEQVKAVGMPEYIKFGLKGHKVWGGDTLTHNATYILATSRTKKETWKAVLVDAPDRPQGEAYFTIRPEGIRDAVA